MKLKTIVKAAKPILLGTLVYKALNTNLLVQRYELSNQKISHNLRIVFLSDLHNNLYGENQSELITKIADQKPDIVLLGGDFFDTVGLTEHTVVLLEWLGNNYPVYFTTGNHELGMKGTESVTDLVDSLGIEAIEGKTMEIPLGSTIFTISGVSDGRKKRLFLKQLKETGNSINPAHYNILLTHRPEKVSDYERHSFDLILAGHSHGGQIRIPGLVNGLYAPNQGFFPKYAGGQYELDNGSTMIVNRGLMIQYQRVPKIFNRPEIVVIDLIKQ